MKGWLPTWLRDDTPGRTSRQHTLAHVTYKTALYSVYTVGLFILLTGLGMAALNTSGWLLSNSMLATSSGKPASCPQCSTHKTPECPLPTTVLTEKQKQMAFCEIFHPIQTPGVMQFHASSLPGSPLLWMYEGNDIVSQHLRKDKTWEAHDIQQLLWAMRQAVPISHANGGTDASDGQGSDLFVDVGANLAWFTVNMAAAGFKVAAFEGMRSNLQLIRSTLCSNPSLAERITLYPVALGTAKATCYLFAVQHNQGNGIANCHAANETEALRAVPAGHAPRGSMQVDRMDVVFPGQDIKAMKIDVEGYEIMVLKGAEGIFKKHTVWFVVMEYNYVNIMAMVAQGTLKNGTDREVMKELPRYVANLGFRISFNSFQGPFIDATSEEQLDALALVGKAAKVNNVFCVNERYFAMQPVNPLTRHFKSAAEILQHAGVPPEFQ